MPVSVHNDFLSKMELLSAERDRYPWGFAMGLTRGTINRMDKGQTPSTETVMALSRYENMRTDWFLLDEGAPYSVIRGRSDAECAETLEAHLVDENWRVHLVTDGTNHAYVLTLPGQYQIKDRWVDYTIIEVITGPCGNETAQVIYRRTFHFESNPLELYQVNVDVDTMHELVSGKLGTYKIALADHALLRKAKPVTGEEIVTQVSAAVGEGAALARVASKSQAASEHPESYKDLDAEVLEAIRDMEEEEKKTVLRLIKALKATG